MGEEEPIAEEELPAEEWVEERIGETRVFEKDVEAQLVTERCSPNKYSPTMKRAWAHDAEPAGSMLHDPKARSYAYSYGNTWALHGAHLRFKAWRESRSRQENRYGRHAVHIHIELSSTVRAEPSKDTAHPSAAHKQNYTYPIATCHGNVKTLSVWVNGGDSFLIVLGTSRNLGVLAHANSPQLAS